MACQNSNYGLDPTLNRIFNRYFLGLDFGADVDHSAAMLAGTDANGRAWVMPFDAEPLATADHSRTTIDGLAGLDMIGAEDAAKLPDPTRMYLEASVEWMRNGFGWMRRHELGEEVRLTEEAFFSGTAWTAVERAQMDEIVDRPALTFNRIPAQTVLQSRVWA